VALTDDGAAFLDRARRVLADLRDAEHLVMGGRSTPQGQLFVTAPAMFGRLHVMPVIAALLGQYPGLSARLLLLDRNVRIIEEGIDVAVRIGQLADSALHTVAIGTVRQVIVASPSYLAARGTPLTPADLRNHDVIASTGIRVGNVWSFRQDAVSLSPRLSVNTIDATIAAAEAGLGLANLLSYQVADAVAAGRLVPVLEDQQAAAVPVSLLFERGRAAMPSARAFIAAMRARAAAGHWSPERS
jgi:DNA-binding transcriptional LysR family regulator